MNLRFCLPKKPWILAALVFAQAIFFGHVAKAQEALHLLRGQVLDKNTREPLPFVNIVVVDGASGTISDIDGFFEVSHNNPIEGIRLSHVGYFTKEVTVNDKPQWLALELERKAIDLAVVHVYPGENPAHRIINLAVQNRDANNPKKSGPFSYTAYSKIVFTHDATNLVADINLFRTTPDSLANKVQGHHLLLVETLTERFFESTLHDNEVVVASRTSGFSEPLIPFMATRHQSFSFYQNHVTISGNEYLSPLSHGSTKRYLFILEETSFSGTDSLFVISYRPRRGSTFDGLQGILNINSNGWAVQGLTAQPATPQGNFSTRVRQLYSRVNGKRWFPTQVDVDFEFLKLPFLKNGAIIGAGKTYLSNINLNPDFAKHTFSNYSIDISKGEVAKDDDFWADYRATPLSDKETNTYKVIDSLGYERNLDGIFRFAETLLQGKVRLGILDFYIDEFVDYTKLDGLKLGAGFTTNHSLSRHLKFRARVARGMKSNQWRTAYSTELLVNENPDLRLGFSYTNRTRERGAPSFLEDIYLVSLEKLRSLLVADLDLHKSHEVWIGVSAFRKQIDLKAYAKKESISTLDHLYPNLDIGYNEPCNFNFFETGLMLRFAAGEKHVLTPTRSFVQTEGKPRVFVTVAAGMEGVMKGQYRYWRNEARIDHRYRIKLGGVQQWSLQAGVVFGSGIPWPKLFTAPSAPAGFWPASARSLATMDFNEFVSNKYFAVFFRHDFEKLITGTGTLWPNISLVSNFAIGWLPNSFIAENPMLKPMNKGFFESGIILTDLLGSGNSTLGVQLMYRYGPHALPSFGQNFSARLFLSITR